VNEQQQQQLRELYDAEARLKQRFTARLDRTSELATKSPTLYVHTVALLALHLQIVSGCFKAPFTLEINLEIYVK